MFIKVFFIYILSAILWRTGGWRWKWVRRYILPLAITLYNWSQKRKWRTLWIFPVLVSAFSLGYGEGKSYFRKFLVGWAWIIPALLMGHWHAIIVPFIWIGLFKLSNTQPYSSIFKWFWVEVIVGGLIGYAYI